MPMAVIKHLSPDRFYHETPAAEKHHMAAVLIRIRGKGLHQVVELTRIERTTS
jgi:hypothetical protein